MMDVTYNFKCLSKQYRVQMGRLLKDTYKSLGINEEVFFEKLAKKLFLKYDTVLKYQFNGVPQYYIENRFHEFFYAVVGTVEKYINDNEISPSLRGEVDKNWKAMRISIMSKYVDIWNKFCKQKWTKFANDERYNLDVKLLDFLTGHWPSNNDGSMSKDQVEQLRQSLMPHMEYLFKKTCTFEPEEMSEFRQDWNRLKQEWNRVRLEALPDANLVIFCDESTSDKVE